MRVLLILDLHRLVLAPSTYRPISLAKQTGNKTNLLHTTDCKQKRKSRTRLDDEKQEATYILSPLSLLNSSYPSDLQHGQ